MSAVQVTVKVQKEAYEVGVLLSNIIKALKAKKPLMQMIGDEFKALAVAIDGIDQLPAEAREDVLAFTNAFLIPIGGGIQALLSKSVDTVPVADAQTVAALAHEESDLGKA